MNELEKELPYYPAGIGAKSALYVVFSDDPEITCMDAHELLELMSDLCDLDKHPFGSLGKTNQLDHYIAAEWVYSGVAVQYYPFLSQAIHAHPTLPLSDSLQESLNYLSSLAQK
jgi:hypothetical protein